MMVRCRGLLLHLVSLLVAQDRVCSCRKGRICIDAAESMNAVGGAPSIEIESGSKEANTMQAIEGVDRPRVFDAKPTAGHFRIHNGQNER